MARWLGDMDDRRRKPAGLLRLVGGMDSFETIRNSSVRYCNPRPGLRFVRRIVIHRLVTWSNRNIGPAWLITHWGRGKRALHHRGHYSNTWHTLSSRPAADLCLGYLACGPRPNC